MIFCLRLSSKHSCRWSIDCRIFQDDRSSKLEHMQCHFLRRIGKTGRSTLLSTYNTVAAPALKQAAWPSSFNTSSRLLYNVCVLDPFPFSFTVCLRLNPSHDWQTCCLVWLRIADLVPLTSRWSRHLFSISLAGYVFANIVCNGEAPSHRTCI